MISKKAQAILEKLGKLNRREERNQALQFAGMGSLAVPVSSAVSNLIEKGHPTGGASLKRWLPARLAGGALAFGALPAVRHALERRNIQKSNLRRQLEKELEAQKIPVTKTSASKKKHMKLRSKTRPYRAQTLLDKLSSESGADLRSPLMGGTKLPTGDSMSEAKKQLQKHQSVGTPKRKETTFENIVPTYGTNFLPKIGGAMDITQDPLVRYLKKHAAESSKPPMDPKTREGGRVKDNEEIALEARKMLARELVSETPVPQKDRGKGAPAKTPASSVKEWYEDYLSRRMQNRSGIAGKYTDKDYKAEPGAVDKVLKGQGAPL